MFDYELESNNKRQLARAYVPIQIMNQVYDIKEALKRGTLFPELYLPYKTNDNRELGGRYYG